MGGGAFAAAVPTEGEHEGLFQTPRMSLEIYLKLRDIYASKLSKYFASGKVAHLKEAPGKADYGDIDFMIAIDGFNNFPEMAHAVGASAYIMRGHGKCSLAVGQDGEPSDSPPLRYKVKQHGVQTSSDGTFADGVFAQIDIETIDPDMYEWRIWHSAYGDKSAILGSIVRTLGFTLTTSGLWLRMKRLDESKDMPYQQIPDSVGKLLLSTDPGMVMQFLGLDIKEHERGFSSKEHLFTWLGSCRMLLPDALMQKRDLSRDRQKTRKRGVFTEFFGEWLPTNKVAPSDVALPAPYEHSALGENVSGVKVANGIVDHNDDGAAGTTTALQAAREHYLAESLDFFGLHDKYDTQHGNLVRFTRNNTAVHLLKPIISEQSGRSERSQGEIIKAMRRWVGFKDGRPIVLEQAHRDEESQLSQLLDTAGTIFKRPDEVVEFVKQNWEDLQMRERARMKGAQYGVGALCAKA